MKIECGIVQDLLPLYNDGVCSAESRELVEEHLKQCSKCREDLAKMKEEIVMKHNDAEDTRAMRAIAKKWKSDKKIFFLTGSFLASLIASIACGVSYNMQGSYIDANGFLIEPFYLIPLTLLFGFIAFVLFIALAITLLVRRGKRKRLLKTV